MKRLTVSLILIFSLVSVFPQRFINPAYGLVSHETMKLRQVEVIEDGVILTVSLENRISDGYFCVDRNTYMVLPDGSRLRMIGAEGIPYCPDVYRFRGIGEVLVFRLFFNKPALLPAWIDLVEECGANCMSVYGITLNETISMKMEKAYGYAETGFPASARLLFMDILDSLADNNHGIKGSLYSGIITMYLREGNEKSAHEWIEKLNVSDVPGKKLYIENLAARGIK